MPKGEEVSKEGEGMMPNDGGSEKGAKGERRGRWSQC